MQGQCLEYRLPTVQATIKRSLKRSKNHEICKVTMNSIELSTLDKTYPRFLFVSHDTSTKKITNLILIYTLPDFFSKTFKWSTLYSDTKYDSILNFLSPKYFFYIWLVWLLLIWWQIMCWCYLYCLCCYCWWWWIK